MKGRLIVIYGVNNTGKTTQAKVLVDRLNASGEKTSYLKYPLYDIVPSGKMIMEYLREYNPHGLSAREAQILYAMNRAQYENELIGRLESGETIVAEDYWGTGVAWGSAAGVDQNFLEELNKIFRREDVGILLSGERFFSGVEKNHLHEQNNPMAEKVAEILLGLARENNWKMVSAKGAIEEVGERIWAAVKKS